MRLRNLGYITDCIYSIGLRLAGDPWHPVPGRRTPGAFLRPLARHPCDIEQFGRELLEGKCHRTILLAEKPGNALMLPVADALQVPYSIVYDGEWSPAIRL